MKQSEFEKELSKHGYSEMRVHDYPADNNVDMHTHDFSVMLLVQSGTLDLVLENETVRYSPGDFCQLDANVSHTEQTGPDGVTALLAIKRA